MTYTYETNPLMRRMTLAFLRVEAANSLEVNITKHDGYPGFIANAGLKSKLNDALKAIRGNR